MKVINELQLDHAEKIEKLNAEIMKKSTEIGELRLNHELLMEKYQLLQRDRQHQQQESENGTEQLTQKYMDELKSTYEQLEKERGEHNKWSKKHEMLQLRFNKQAEIYKTEIQKLNHELQNENRSLLSSNEAKLNKHKVEKMEESLSKLKEEMTS
jgi:chromosome segregation ATPase